MAHIPLNNENMPGITGLLDYSPLTAGPLTDLANILLHDDSSLSRADREIIASSVSYWNDCHFCHSSHGAVAAAHLQLDVSFIDEIKAGLPRTEVSQKLRALLEIAHHVQQGGKKVTQADIDAARETGATDHEIHDTVLIAAAFCMYNRYVDGLGTWSPREKEAYADMGYSLAKHGYEQNVPTV